MIFKRGCSDLRNLFYLCLTIPVFNILYGCTASNDYVSESKIFINQITEQVETEIVDERNDANVEISFKEACIEAAQNDKNILSLQEKLRQSQIEVSGVHSHLWPRLKLNLNSDIPITSKDDSEFDLTGGFYLDYDIRKAIAISDETTLRKAAAEQNILKLQLSLILLQGNLKKLLNQIALLHFKVEKKTQALDLSRNAFHLAKIYAAENKLDSLALASWKKRVDSLEVELTNLRNQLKGEQYALSDLLGRNIGKPLTIVNTDQHITDNSSPPTDQLAAAQIWEKHIEARLYELELIAAEAAAQLVALERLPQIDAELGLGDIPLENSDTGASSLLRLNLSLPLYDFGDHSRKVAKAQIVKDRVRSSLKSKITKLYNRAQLASIAHASAKDNLKQATATLENMKELIARKKILISESRADNLGLYPDLINRMNLEIFQLEAVHNVERTADELRFAAGENIVDNSIFDTLTGQ